MYEMSAADWDWLQNELPIARDAFCAQLRSVRDSGTKVPNLDWDVAGLGQHIVSLTKLYRDQHALGDGFVAPSDWAQFSIDARSHLTATAPDELAQLIESESEVLLSDIGDDPNAPRKLYGQSTTAANTVAGYVSELVLHGQDLALLGGPKPEYSDRHARTALRQSMCLAPAFVVAEEARKCAGTYGLRFRGAEDYTWTVDDGALTITPGWPAQADARMSADPRSFALVSLGRMNQFKPALSGKMVAYGRKPWMFLRLGNIAADGF